MMQAQVAISPEENYARNRPGVVKVQTEFSANVYVNKVQINERRFEKLVDSVKKLDTSGIILNPEKKLDIVLKALYSQPLHYFFRTAEYLRQEHRIVSTGTGFFISGDGYLITNCHVIDRDSAYIRKQFILSTFREVTDANINSLQSSWEMKLTDEQRNLLYNTYEFIYSRVSTMILFDLQKKIYVEYRGDIDDSGSVTLTKPARVIIKGKPMPGKDIALLKVDAGDNLPGLFLSKEPIERVGSQIYVYGYPGYVSNNLYLAPDATIEPTLTTGIVSGIKKSIGGWPVIQTDAAISYGSSGGPVCDQTGRVIGVATFGSIEQNSGELASGFNFAIPVSIVWEYLDSAKVKTEISDATENFNEGLTQYFQHFYRKALRNFEKTAELNNGYPQLDFYMQSCKTRIAAGADRQSLLFKWILTFVLVVILGVLSYFLLQKKKINARNH
jgi:S1-C subfamily serine protease